MDWYLLGKKYVLRISVRFIFMFFFLNLLRHFRRTNVFGVAISDQTTMKLNTVHFRFAYLYIISTVKSVLGSFYGSVSRKLFLQYYVSFHRLRKSFGWNIKAKRLFQLQESRLA